MTSIKEYPFHPLANLFPLMEGDEFAALVQDIRQHGLHEPIVVYEGMILDGRNRHRACREAGVKPRYREIIFGTHAETVAYLIGANIHRRHLTTVEQRRGLIENLLKTAPEKSNRQIAKEAGVSHPYVAKIRSEAEKKGDVETVSTSVDTKGRSQPRRRSKPKSEGASGLPPAQPAYKTAPKQEAKGAGKSSPTAPDGPYSAGEPDRLRARIDELHDEKRRLEIRVIALENENAELRARIAGLVAQQTKSPINASSPIDSSTPSIAAPESGAVVESSVEPPTVPNSGATLEPTALGSPPNDDDLNVQKFAGGSLRR
jgi:hypothetical protein